MSKIIAAKYHAEQKIAEFVCDDGRRCFRMGGKLPWRINNPGDLSSPLNASGQPAPKLTAGFIGFASASNSKHFFFIFPDEKTGWRELKASLQRKYIDFTIPKIIPTYAPSHENNSDKYLADTLKITEISAEKTVRDMTDSEVDKLVKAIGTIEGFFSEADSQKEFWFDSSTIIATDGNRPIPDAVLQIVSEGKTKEIRSDRYGEFPPILHLNKDASVHVKARDRRGRDHHLAQLPGNRSQTYKAKYKSMTVHGVAAPHEAAGAPQRSRIPFKYITHPGDTVEKLAQLFEIAPEKLLSDNALRSTKLLPSQEIWIYGRAPVSAPKSARALAPAQAAPSHPDESWLANLGDRINGWFGRTKSGLGNPLSLFDAKPVRAPWMQIALREAKLFAGKNEVEINKTRNYHRLITDSDRAGGRTKEQQRSSHKKEWDGLPSLVGGNNPWCAAFVNYCLKEAGYPPAAAIASSFGFGDDKIRFKKIDKPTYGAIRFNRTEKGGHVCFVYGKIGEKLVVLGGNQGDEISFEHPSFEKGKAFYLPISYVDPTSLEELQDIDIRTLKDEFGSCVKNNLRSTDRTR